MFNKGQLAGLMKQAQAMQDNLKKAQDELATFVVLGVFGVGLVLVSLFCLFVVFCVVFVLCLFVVVMIAR